MTQYCALIPNLGNFWSRTYEWLTLTLWLLVSLKWFWTLMTWGNKPLGSGQQRSFQSSSEANSGTQTLKSESTSKQDSYAPDPRLASCSDFFHCRWKFSKLHLFSLCQVSNKQSTSLICSNGPRLIELIHMSATYKWCNRTVNSWQISISLYIIILHSQHLEI